MAGADDEIVNNPPPTTPVTQQAPHTMSTIKLLILKKDTSGQIKILPPKSTEEMWEAIKSRFEGLHKGYDRFQSLLSQLEIQVPENVAFVSSECTSSTNEVTTAYGVSTSFGCNSQRESFSSYSDKLMYSFFANQSSGPQLDHEDLEQIDEFDLEEMDLKWQVAMISMRLKKFYKKTGRKLAFDAKEPVGFNKTKVECFNCHKTGHFARECRSKGNQDIRRKDTENTGYKARDNGRRPANQVESNALVVVDGDGIEWLGMLKKTQRTMP
ncbi:ribonuclease H-like domain-containing protein [Tanacetum coccineum]